MTQPCGFWCRLIWQRMAHNPEVAGSNRVRECGDCFGRQVRYGRRVGESLRPEELARALRDLQVWAVAHAPAEESQLRVRVREHLVADPAELPVASREI